MIDEPLFPSRGQIRCSGISFIIAQILLLISGIVGTSIGYDLYSVTNEDEVTDLHNLLSSSDHRRNTEISVSLMWIAFPFLLMGLYGLKKHATYWCNSTGAEMYIYIFEKAYIMWITVLMIVIPALSLVSVSYDWSFEETTVGSTVQTGYYIQLYAITFVLELIDCAAIADATFILAFFIMSLIMMYKAKMGNQKLIEYLNVIHKYDTNPKSYYCIQSLNCLCVIIAGIVFIIILFEFAQSGFLSPSGPAKVLVIWSILYKILLGFALIAISTSNKYEQLKAMHKERENKEKRANNNMLAEHNYQMEQINVKHNQ
eukprot:223409_1